MKLSVGTAVALPCGCEGRVQGVDIVSGIAEVVLSKEGFHEACLGTLGALSTMPFGRLIVVDVLTDALDQAFQ